MEIAAVLTKRTVKTISALTLTGLLLAGSSVAESASASVITVGRSVEDRPIEVRRFGEPAADFKVLMVGSIHGDEPEGMRVIRRINQLARPGLKRIDLWSIRTVNPDGLARGSRKNAGGVDLNRNFPYRFDPTLNDGYNSGPRPLSEPESRTVARITRRWQFDLSIWYHQPWDKTLAPCNETGPVARLYGRWSGLPAGSRCDPDVPGSVIGWMHRRFNTAAFVVEFPGRRLREAEVNRHARTAIRLSKRLR